MTGADLLVPGSVVGFRQFRVRPDGSLAPLFVDDAPWRVGVTEARCTLDRAHRPPDPGCRCGLYAWYHPDDALLHRAPGLVTAAVRLEGRIVLGEHGLRAERGEVTAVCLPSRLTTPHRTRQRVARTIRARHPQVEVYDDVRAFRRGCPPDDLTGLGVPAPSPVTGGDRRFHVAWAGGIVAFGSAVLWPGAVDGFMDHGGWAAIPAAVVGWQAYLLRATRGTLVGRSTRPPG